MGRSSKTFLFLLLIMKFQFYSQVRAEALTESKSEASCAYPNESVSLNDRLSAIESENRHQKHEMFLLKKTVDDDKKFIAHLVTALDEEKKVVNQLKGRIERLEVSAPNNSLSTEKSIIVQMEALANTETRNRFKRQVENIAKTGNIGRCSDSSRLCTFFYPDHPDVLKGTKTVTSSSYKKMMEKVTTGPPTSCKELNLLGHTLNGIYLVSGSGRNPTKVILVHCNFNDILNLETLIGNVEVKTRSVHFYVQRQSDFVENAIIPFEVERLNVGEAMNLATGVFTAPVPGIYHFAFSCLKHSNFPYTDIYLQLNGGNIGRATFNSEEGRGYASITLHSSLKLKKGDRISLFKEFGSIHDNNDHMTHFSGWLVEEELSLLTVV